jgi:hypothetical protein
MRLGRVLLSGAAVAAVALIGASPAAPAANDRAGCFPVFVSGFASSAQGPALGEFASSQATTFGGVGQFVSVEASTRVCFGG